MLLNCAIGQDPWESLELKADQTLKEINPDHSLEGLLLELKLQYFGHLMQRIDSLEKTLMPGKIKGKRKRDESVWDGWMALPTQWTWIWANSRRQWRTGKPGMLQSMGSQRIRHDLVTEQQQNHFYMWNLNYGRNKPVFKTNRITDTENRWVVANGEGVKRGGLEVWD